MLPFMKPRNQGMAIIVKERAPDHPAGEQDSHKDEEIQELTEIAEDYLRAIHSNDPVRIAECWRIAHDTLHYYMDRGNKAEEA